MTVPDSMPTQLWLHIGAATATRLLLTAGGLGRPLQKLVAVATPLTSLVRVREALWLLRYGSSPYTGSAYHAPPLLLPLLASFADHPLLYAVPCAAADAGAAVLLARLAAALHRNHKQNAAGGVYAGRQPVSPTTVAALYLWNPLTAATCCGGSLGSLENLAVFAGACGGVTGNAPLAAFGAVAAGYLSLHPLLQLLPIALLLWRGPEDLFLLAPSLPTAQPASDEDKGRGVDNAGSSAAQQSPTLAAASLDGMSAEPTPNPNAGSSTSAMQHGNISSPDAQKPSQHVSPTAISSMSEEAASLQTQMQRHFGACFTHRRRQRGRALAAAFLCFCALWAAALILLSDLALGRHSEHRCGGLLALLQRWGGALALPGMMRGASGGGGEGGCGGAAGLSSGRHWIRETYGFLLQVEDLAPNIGMHWYLFAEAFPSWRPAALAAFQLAPAALALPLAFKFPHRPLLLVLLQSVAHAFMKPYPSVGDLAQYLALMPFFRWQLLQLGDAQFLATAFLLIAALAPAMWHMWIYVGSANANFFYAITLLFGAWQAMLSVQLVLASQRHDRLLAGRPV